MLSIVLDFKYLDFMTKTGSRRFLSACTLVTQNNNVIRVTIHYIIYYITLYMLHCYMLHVGLNTPKNKKGKEKIKRDETGYTDGYKIMLLSTL